MPLRRAFENPVLAREGDSELYRAMRGVTTQLNRERARSGRVYPVWLSSVSASVSVPLIGWVTRSRFGLGRITYCFNADTTASKTAYWTFAVVRYFTDTSDGTRVSRPITTWGTDEVAPKAFDPYSVLVDDPLRPGDTLVLEITKTGSPSAVSLSVTVEEVFRREG